MAAMTFESLDSNQHAQRCPGLQLAWAVLNAPAGSTAVLNAANEVAVAAFLERQIRFDQIHAVNEASLSAVRVHQAGSIDELLALDAEARSVAAGFIRGLAP